MYFVELDDVGVPENFEDAYLSGDSFDIGLLHYFLFLKGLDGDLHIGGNVNAQPNLTKCALTDGLA